MGFFDFLDTRKSIAKWVAKLFREARQQNAHASIQEIITVILYTRYHVIGPKGRGPAILRARRNEAIDIFSLCHLIAEVELLSHLNDYDRIMLQMGGENIIRHTYRVMDEELIKLGFSPS